MSYQVLARKWRPRRFSELVGQEHVVNAISNALDNDRLHHAYLFTGTRGVGKTTIARIFAKSLNCESGQSANPCGKCDTCIDIEQGRFVDLLEIDAASRTKVEDTRELLDNVQYRPTRGDYKVYLIDEVHMLSKHSFNALLKTLEEPPPHVKFLLATTDPQKLPITILSRCLQFNLKALSREQIAKQLAFVLNEESIEHEAQALQLIARSAQGSMRDALSLTDQAIAQGNNHVTQAVVTDMLGLLDRNHIVKILHALATNQSNELFAVIDDVAQKSPDFSQILKEINATLHQVALTQIVPDACKLDTSHAKTIYQLSKMLTAEHVQLLYQIGVDGLRTLEFAPDPRSGVEMIVLRMLAFSPIAPISDTQKVITQANALSTAQPDEKAVASPNATETSTVSVDTTRSSDSELMQQNAPQTHFSSSDDDDERHQQMLAEQLDYEQQTIEQQSKTMRSTPASQETKASEQQPVASAPPTSPLERTKAMLALRQRMQEEAKETGKKPDNASKEDVPASSSVGRVELDSVDVTPAPVEKNAPTLPDSTMDMTSLSAFLPNGDKLIQAAQIDEWSAIVNQLSIAALVKQVAINSTFEKNDNEITLLLAEAQQHLLSNTVEAQLSQSLKEWFGCPISLRIEVGIPTDTPFQIQQRIDDVRLAHAKAVAQDDPAINHLLSAFNANVVEDSITPR
ncbi:DNA polymerase III subunit gamma/tau [Alteromonas oceanisediminis]|uniref:DNA polymerase III subunit gamma/tau n=1 Tax=Alteromonas oceanisediminis TaxID=2836180 RepID=UPI001BDB06D7|nr:DNA polymerase III subunit gamma/tau [Alteromonas oceanisediminis]MBT0587496.1 DNA polymerase III subunit gamma/tau [Alteromonas oceanisediminis]